MLTRLTIYLFVLVSFLALFGLGNTSFREEEAHNAIDARHLIAPGEFTSREGRRLPAFLHGARYEEDLSSVRPPLPAMLAAIGFAVFGFDAFGGRVPFALCGLLTLPVIYCLTRRAAPAFPRTALYTVSALGMSVSFLLYIRQCCYYAPAILFASLLVLCYQEAVHRKSRTWTLTIAIAAILLFYSHFLIAVAALAALGLAFIIFDARKLDRSQWTTFILSAVLVASLTLPYAISKEIWASRDSLPQNAWVSQRLDLIWWNFRDLNSANWLPWVLVLCGLFTFFVRRRPRVVPANIGRLLVFAAAYVLAIALLSPPVNQGATYADIRYLVAALPILAVFSGMILASIHRIRPLLALALWLLLINTNLLSVAPSGYASRPQWMLPDFLLEIAHPHPESGRTTIEHILTAVEKDASIDARPDLNPQKYSNALAESPSLRNDSR